MLFLHVVSVVSNWLNVIHENKDSKMKNLEQTRREIDRIDEGLVKLFLERLAVSRDESYCPI